MTTSPEALQEEQKALIAALAQLLEPMAKLCLAKGVPIQAVEKLVRRSYVNAATQACEGFNPDRLTSRISTMTGLTRREVSRIQENPSLQLPVTRSVANDVLTYWTSQSAYVNEQGRPVQLPRQGVGPSFEALAGHVTKDVHSRSILAEMIRLNLVAHDKSTDMVRLLEEIYVPSGDWRQMVGFLGVNVGDHLDAAVANVLGDGHQHFEQALLADELSTESVEKAKKLINGEWRRLLTSLGPKLQALMDADKDADRTQNQQLRIGLYTNAKPMPENPSSQLESE